MKVQKRRIRKSRPQTSPKSNNNRPSLGLIIVTSLAFGVGSLLGLAGLVIAREFGKVSVDSVIFHARVINVAKVDEVSVRLISDLVLLAIVPSL